MNDRSIGLYAKYRVERLDKKPVGKCFVLELSDPNSWPALETWARTVEDDGYQRLADDVRNLLEVAKAQVQNKESAE